MHLVIDNRIRFKKSELPEGSLAKIKESFRYKNPEYFKKRNLGLYTGNTPQTIGTFKVNDNGSVITIPRGGLRKLLDILCGFGIDFKLIDKRPKVRHTDLDFSSDIILRPYQEKAIREILHAETCLIEGAPASGKTEILLSAIAKSGLKAGVLVHDRNLFNQWIGRIESRLGIPNKKIGKIGAGKFKIGDQITVMMQQTARNKIDLLKDEFDFLACDEVHHYAAKTFLETVDAFTARYRVGVSATVKRQDLKHFLTHDLFGEIVFSISREELVDLGYTAEIELNIIHTNFEYDYRNESALRDCLEDSYLDYDELTAKEKQGLAEKYELERKDYPQYLDASSLDSDKNNLIYQWVRREYDKGSTSVIFTKRRKHCELWESRLKKVGLECVIFWSAKGNKREEKRIKKDLQRLKSKKVRIAIGTTLDEGLNMPAVDAGFITYRNAGNPGQLEQQAGRLARLFAGKDFGKLFYFHDVNINAFSGDETRLLKRFKKAVVHEKTRKRKKIRFKK